MGYRSLAQCVNDLATHGHLVRVEEQVDAHLEIAEIQRRLYINQGPAVLFTNVKDCSFPMVGNLFGTMDRARFMFRDTLESVRRLIELKIEPNELMRQPMRYWKSPLAALRMLPRRVRIGPVLSHQTSISKLPQLVSWPDDGGPYITLPQVYTEDVRSPGVMKSNLGMYRVQLTGEGLKTNEDLGLHYQIHRGIGVHHTAAIAAGRPLDVNIFVGGTPAMSLSAVMPLPEGLSELQFAGALAGHRIPMITDRSPIAMYAEADFCITGTVSAEDLTEEGPFGDHLGYYSLRHPFPRMKVTGVYHRPDAIWPYTVVGRPPQEDTTFGELIHEITGPVIPSVLPGIHAVNAVDAAGVHPLLLAIGSERYVPYQQRARPQELMTQACAILGQGQMSLAKYLMIVAHQDNPELDIHQIDHFLMHVLQRADWTRDLHFITETTIDTLDYSSGQFNHGSKVIMTAVGPSNRELLTTLPPELSLPDGFQDPQIPLPGVLAIRGPRYDTALGALDPTVSRFCEYFDRTAPINQFPLVLIVDDSQFTAQSLNNLLWVTFTRSNPAADIHGIDAFNRQKHWGCQGSLVLDARLKPWNAPPLVEDPQITAKIDAMAARGGPLAQFL